MAEKVGTDAERFGRAVQVRRAELGLKRPELAKRADLSYPYVSEIENGMKTPSTKALAQLAQALELSPAELMVRAESLEPPLWEDRQPPLDPAFDDLSPQRRLVFHRHPDVPAPAPADNTPGLTPVPAHRGGAPDDRPDRRTEDLVTAIVRAEIAAWARTELPALVQAELNRILAEREQ